MEPAIRFEDHVGLVHFQAKKGFKWAQGAGCPLDYEDMLQEASLAFVQAARGFNPNAGVKFSAYYTQAAFSQFNKAIGRMTGVKRLNDEQRQEIAERKEENARRREAALPELPEMNYGLAPILFSDLESPTEEGFDTFESTLSDDGATPEEIVATRELMNQAMKNLSPLASLMLEWLRDPPPEMLQELERQAAYADRAQELGVLTRGLRDGVSLANVKKFIALIGEVPKSNLALAEAELMEVIRKIEEA